MRDKTTKKCSKCKHDQPLTMYSDPRETMCILCKRKSKKS